MNGIRNCYEAFGADEYYRKFGEGYTNPHQGQVTDLLVRNAHRWAQATTALDFCAGGGEATLALTAVLGAEWTGCDPFTHTLYEKQTGHPCLTHDFEQVIKGAPLGHYDLAICSFALHLCPEKDLFPVVWALLAAAPVLVIVTPHKRPELERIPGVVLRHEDFVLTERGKKVRLKEYSW